jgi:hypothetical protein
MNYDQKTHGKGWAVWASLPIDKMLGGGILAF